MSGAPRNEPQRGPALDFLWRVIDSAFERTSPLEPRLPSRFEPQTVAVGTVSWPAEFADGDGERAASAQVEVRPEREVHGQTVPRDVAPSREDPRVDMDPPDASRRRAAPAPARPRDEETDRNVLTAKPLPVTVDARRGWRAETAQEPEPPTLNLPSGVLLAQKVISTTETIRQPTGVRAPERREASPTSTEWSERSQSHSVAPAPQIHRVVVEPPTTRHRPARDPLHADVAKRSPDPVVNVTIGRIEVCAVPAQPSSTRQRSQGPKPMSLDDYLKQRGDGR